MHFCLTYKCTSVLPTNRFPSFWLTYKCISVLPTLCQVHLCLTYKCTSVLPTSALPPYIQVHFCLTYKCTSVLPTNALPPCNERTSVLPTKLQMHFHVFLSYLGMSYLGMLGKTRYEFFPNPLFAEGKNISWELAVMVKLQNVDNIFQYNNI